jgi:hypothetical protein
MGRTCSAHEEEDEYIHTGVLVRKPEEKRPLERIRCKWDDDIKMDLREVGWSDMD